MPRRRNLFFTAVVVACSLHFSLHVAIRFRLSASLPPLFGSPPAAATPTLTAAQPAPSAGALVAPTRPAPAPAATPATVVIAGRTVTKYAFTPYLPTYLLEGYRLKSVKAIHDAYFLQYLREPDQSFLHITEAFNMRYNWSVAPELADLPHMQLEIGNGGSKAPSLLIVRVHLTDAPGAPDFIIYSSGGWDEVKPVILSLQPVK